MVVPHYTFVVHCGTLHICGTFVVACIQLHTLMPSHVDAFARYHVYSRMSSRHIHPQIWRTRVDAAYVARVHTYADAQVHARIRTHKCMHAYGRTHAQICLTIFTFRRIRTFGNEDAAVPHSRGGGGGGGDSAADARVRAVSSSAKNGCCCRPSSLCMLRPAVDHNAAQAPH